MRDLLVPIFGDWGAVVAQYLLTVVIVLGLIGAVWWVMRRYSGVRFGGIGRGRVPRLAIVDAMAIDRRRRLILVRRDNVEHLLLIGGPSDVVVEGTIQRVRQRSVQAAAQAAVARATLQPAVETPAEPESPQPEMAGAGEPSGRPTSRSPSRFRAAPIRRRHPATAGPSPVRAATAGPSARVSRHAGTGGSAAAGPDGHLCRAAAPDPIAADACRAAATGGRAARAGGTGTRGASPRGHDGGGRALAAGATACSGTGDVCRSGVGGGRRGPAIGARPRRRGRARDRIRRGGEETAPATAPEQDGTAPADPHQGQRS